MRLNGITFESTEAKSLTVKSLCMAKVAEEGVLSVLGQQDIIGCGETRTYTQISHTPVVYLNGHNYSPPQIGIYWINCEL